MCTVSRPGACGTRGTRPPARTAALPATDGTISAAPVNGQGPGVRGPLVPPKQRSEAGRHPTRPQASPGLFLARRRERSPPYCVSAGEFCTTSADAGPTTATATTSASTATRALRPTARFPQIPVHSHLPEVDVPRILLPSPCSRTARQRQPYPARAHGRHETFGPLDRRDLLPVCDVPFERVQRWVPRRQGRLTLGAGVRPQRARARPASGSGSRATTRRNVASSRRAVVSRPPEPVRASTSGSTDQGARRSALSGLRRRTLQVSQRRTQTAAAAAARFPTVTTATSGTQRDDGRQEQLSDAGEIGPLCVLPPRRRSRSRTRSRRA